MKEKRHIGEILRGADEPTAERIAELSPPADAETKDRIFAQIQERMNKPESLPEEHFTVTAVHRTWKKYAAAAASLLLAVGIGGAVLTRGLPSQSPVQEELAASQYAEETAQDISEPEETHAEAVPETEVLPEHAWTQDEVWNLCMKSRENLMEYGRFSCDTVKTSTLNNSLQLEVQGVVELDFDAQIYNSCATHFMYYPDSVYIQENQWYYADGCELWLINYKTTDSEDIGEFMQPEQAFLFEGRGNGDFPCSTPFYMETFLSDFSLWEIAGTDVYCHRVDESSGEEMLRACIVLDVAGGAFIDSVDAASHRVLVDAETGMWLKLEDLDKDGNVIGKMQLNDLKFGADAEITHPYNIGQKITKGEYFFETPTALTDVFLIHPTDYAPEETTVQPTTETAVETVVETVTETADVTEPTETEPTETKPTAPALTETVKTTAQTTPALTETVKTTAQTTPMQTQTAPSVLTPEQEAALAQLREQGERMFGAYIRQEKIITGELAADAPRLTRVQMQAIIAESTDFADILARLKAVQPYPDFIGGSGVTNVEYWLDDEGMEQIYLTLEQEDVTYVKEADAEHDRIWERLY